MADSAQLILDYELRPGKTIDGNETEEKVFILQRSCSFLSDDGLYDKIEEDVEGDRVYVYFDTIEEYVRDNENSEDDEVLEIVRCLKRDMEWGKAKGKCCLEYYFL